MRITKPIRVFWSPLSRKFYASSAYREEKPGVVIITGKQFDVTQDIARLIVENDIVFEPRVSPLPSAADLDSMADEQQARENTASPTQD